MSVVGGSAGGKHFLLFPLIEKIYTAEKVAMENWVDGDMGNMRPENLLTLADDVFQPVRRFFECDDRKKERNFKPPPPPSS